MQSSGERPSIERLKRHVADLTREPRPPESASLDSARNHVEALLRDSGWQVRRHSFQAQPGSGGSLQGVNLVATIRTAENVPSRFCLGAHLDSRPETPGADDNASGVAALLEIARLLPHLAPDPPAVDLELVVFDLEEAGMLGGAEHARLAKAAKTNLCGMVALEMIAYRDSAAGSQQLPRTLVGKYPDTGDFIAVIGNESSHRLIERFRAGLARVPGLPVETLAVPGNGELLQASRLSDHSPFWDAGFQALMITDTSFLRNPHYHLPTDTAETLDYEFLSGVTEGTLNAVCDIMRSGL